MGRERWWKVQHREDSHLKEGGRSRHEKSLTICPNLPFLPAHSSYGLKPKEVIWTQYNLFNHGERAVFTTLNFWHLSIRNDKQRQIIHRHLTQHNPPLLRVFPLVSSLINLLAPFCTPDFSHWHTHSCTHTHTLPTQAVRNHKTCCFFSFSDGNLLATWEEVLFASHQKNN